MLLTGIRPSTRWAAPSSYSWSRGLADRTNNSATTTLQDAGKSLRDEPGTHTCHHRGDVAPSDSPCAMARAPQTPYSSAKSEPTTSALGAQWVKAPGHALSASWSGITRGHSDGINRLRRLCRPHIVRTVIGPTIGFCSPPAVSSGPLFPAADELARILQASGPELNRSGFVTSRSRPLSSPCYYGPAAAASPVQPHDRPASQLLHATSSTAKAGTESQAQNGVESPRSDRCRLAAICGPERGGQKHLLRATDRLSLKPDQVIIAESPTVPCTEWDPAASLVAGPASRRSPTLSPFPSPYREVVTIGAILKPRRHAIHIGTKWRRRSKPWACSTGGGEGLTSTHRAARNNACTWPRVSPCSTSEDGCSMPTSRPPSLDLNLPATCLFHRPIAEGRPPGAAVLIACTT